MPSLRLAQLNLRGLAYLVKRGDCRTRWGTLVRSDIGPGVAGRTPATPVIFCTLSKDEPSFFVKRRQGGFPVKEEMKVFYVEFSRQKRARKLHRPGKPTIFIRLRRKFAMIIFQRKREMDVFQVQQTNDSFDSGNLHLELHRLKSFSIMAMAG